MNLAYFVKSNFSFILWISPELDYSKLSNKLQIHFKRELWSVKNPFYDTFDGLLEKLFKLELISSSFCSKWLYRLLSIHFQIYIEDFYSNDTVTINITTGCSRYLLHVIPTTYLDISSHTNWSDLVVPSAVYKQIVPYKLSTS